MRGGGREWVVVDRDPTIVNGFQCYQYDCVMLKKTCIHSMLRNGVLLWVKEKA